MGTSTAALPPSRVNFCCPVSSRVSSPFPARASSLISVLVPVLSSQCSLDAAKNDGTYVKLDLNKLALSHYGAGDTECKNRIRESSLKDSFKKDAPECNPRYVCGGTTQYDLDVSNPAETTHMDCATNFVTLSIERNDFVKIGDSPNAAQHLTTGQLLGLFLPGATFMFMNLRR